MCVTFLFGSGADTDFNDELKSGQAFAEQLLLEKNAEEIRFLIGEEYAKYKLIYPASTKVFLQTIETFYDEAKVALGEYCANKCYNYRRSEKDNSDAAPEIRDICRVYYNAINNLEIDKDKRQKYLHREHGEEIDIKEVREFFLKRAVFFDALDEKFNSLRNPRFNNNARRVIWAYATIFVFMIKSIYKDIIPLNFPWTYEKIFGLLANSGIQYKPDDKCYYSQLCKSDISYNIVTTNYTSAVETAIKDNEHRNEEHREVVYLHGKLTWFEDLRTFSIFDCTDTNERNRLLEIISNSNLEIGGRDKIIPFILIPSGVKPLICTKQIEQFSKFINYLDGSDRLCVVGYRFNSEDNHINSIIAEWLRKDNNRKMDYFNFNNEVVFSNLSWTIGVEEQINSIEIKESDCREKFADYLNELNK